MIEFDKTLTNTLYTLFIAVLFVFAYALYVIFTKNTTTQHEQIKTIYIHDTIYKELDTVFLFSKDSEFLKALQETETSNLEKLEKGYPLSNKIDASGKYYGVYQISQMYLDGCDLAQFLEFGLDDMLDPAKATIAVIAKTIKQIKRFKRQHKRIPTQTELARIHVGGYSKRFDKCTDKYSKKFNKNLLNLKQQ